MHALYHMLRKFLACVSIAIHPAHLNKAPHANHAPHTTHATRHTPHATPVHLIQPPQPILLQLPIRRSTPSRCTHGCGHEEARGQVLLQPAEQGGDVARCRLVPAVAPRVKHKGQSGCKTQRGIRLGIEGGGLPYTQRSFLRYSRSIASILPFWYLRRMLQKYTGGRGETRAPRAICCRNP